MAMTLPFGYIADWDKHGWPLVYHPNVDYHLDDNWSTWYRIAPDEHLGYKGPVVWVQLEVYVPSVMTDKEGTMKLLSRVIGYLLPFFERGTYIGYTAAHHRRDPHNMLFQWAFKGESIKEELGGFIVLSIAAVAALGLALVGAAGSIWGLSSVIRAIRMKPEDLDKPLVSIPGIPTAVWIGAGILLTMLVLFRKS